MITKIYIDESGFTGNNLLDPVQPYFTIASTNITEVQAESILKRSFPDYKVSEYKFQLLWKTKTGRNSLVDFCKQLEKYYGNIFIYLMDKRLVVLTKMVDYLIEPIFHEKGFDFYADDYNRKFVNVMYFSLTKFGEKEIFSKLIKTYQNFSRYATKETLNTLQVLLNQLTQNSIDEHKIFLDLLQQGAEKFEDFHSIKEFKSTDEIQFTAMLSTITYWRKRCTNNFHIYHDNTANFTRKKNLWKKITDNNVVEQDFHLGDGTTVRLPLRVLKTSAVDSKLNSSVQLADVLAGLSNKWFSRAKDDRHSELLDCCFENGFKYIQYAGVQFSPEFLEDPPHKLVDLDSIDRFRNIVFS